jgi:hypothetical protein
MTMDELRQQASTSPDMQARVAKRVTALRAHPSAQTSDQLAVVLLKAKDALARVTQETDIGTRLRLQVEALALDELTREKAPAVMTGDALERLTEKLAKTKFPGAPDEPKEVVDAVPGRRRRVLVPAFEPGDMVALRYLASFRFASPAALAAFAWPERSADGQEWRMRRMVACGMFGRRRLYFAASRHVVWARSMATQIVLSPPPPRPLVSPRWNEDSARHGWMRSVALHAYVRAGWKIQLAGTEGPLVEALKRSFLRETAIARLFGDGQSTYPFDLALGVRRSDNKGLLHIVIPDDPSSGLDRIMAALPFEVPGRSSRVGVRFFPIDDFTFWSRSASRYTMHSPRSLRILTGLTNAGLDIPPENAGPEIGHWAELR